MSSWTNTTKKSTYNNATAYSVNDTVFYAGLKYKCILSSTGNLPTNATYWVLDTLWTNTSKS